MSYRSPYTLYIFIGICLVGILLLLRCKAGAEGFTNKKYNLAFYTCFYGEVNNPAFKIPALPSEKYDCYYFSNNKEVLKKVEDTLWIPVYDNKELTEDEIQSCMNGKHVKVYPEDYTVLEPYDYLCFLDSKLEKLSESFIENLIHEYFITQDYALLLRHHVFLDGSVWNEFTESMKQERYARQKDTYLSYIHEQINSGLRDTTEEHAQCGLLIRNMNHRNITRLDKTWYSHIQRCGIQDQISFFFVKQLYSKEIHMFKEVPFAQ